MARARKHKKKKVYAGLNYLLIPDMKKDSAEKDSAEKDSAEKDSAENDSAEFFKYFNALHECRDSWEPADTPALIRLCQQYILRDEIRQEICTSKNLLETGRSGEKGRTSYVKNPLLSTLTALNADILAMEKELLLTPKARRVSGTKKQNKENPFFALQEEKAKRANSSLAN